MDTKEVILKRIINDINEYNKQSEIDMILIKILNKVKYKDEGFDFKKEYESEIIGIKSKPINKEKDNDRNI